MIEKPEKTVKQRLKILSRNYIRDVLKNWHLYVLLFPAFLYLVIFKYAPLYGIQIAFKRYRVSQGITGSIWIGLEHFKNFITSPQFERVFVNTVFLSLYELVVSFPVPIILALMLNHVRSLKYKNFLENVFYIPHFISVVVLVGMINTFFSVQGGIINIVIASLGGERINFMANASMFKHLYVFSGVWKNSGWRAIVFIAALTSIDPALYEAATIDGAGTLSKILHIDIPCIMPTIVIMLIMAIGNVMSIGYEKVYLMQNYLTISKSEIIATYVYKVGLLRSQYDYATAIGLFNNIINAFLIVAANSILKKITKTGLW